MKYLIAISACLFAFSVYGQGACNNQTTITYQGYEYDIVEIGEQCWFAENLMSTQFSDGSAIDASAVVPFNNDVSNMNAWGLMYEGTAVIDSRGLCPSDWHISSNADWQEIIDYAANNGFNGNEVSALKSVSGWISGANGIDAFGFNAQPGGFHYNPVHPTWGEFNHSMESGYWWTSTIQSAGHSYAVTLQNNYFIPYYAHSNGMSVRCIRSPMATAVDELEALSVLIYPNPVTSVLNLDLGGLEGEDVRIQLYDASGKLLFEELRNSSFAMDVSTYASGLYSIVILTSDAELKRQIVIE